MFLAMHIPDGFLDPVTAAVTTLISAAAIAYCFVRLRNQAGSRLAPLVGITAAAIFAAQMVNFTLIGLQTSGHLMGGVLAAVVLGPWAGAVAITSVLFVQCFLFADGGVTALGANVLNMGVIGAVVGYGVYSVLRRLIGGSRGAIIAATLASWIIVPCSALAFAVEMAAGGEIPLMPVMTLMLFYHIWIGLGEAVLTGFAVSWLVRVRPDLIYDPAAGPREFGRTRQLVVGGLAAALAIVIFAAPWASEFEDGLEKVASYLKFDRRATQLAAAPLADYTLPRVGAEGDRHGGWIIQTAGVVTAIAGTIGTLVTLAFALIVSSSVQFASRRTRTVHAS